jgi:RNA polymerase sigma factor (TIGR02999 family)
MPSSPDVTSVTSLLERARSGDVAARDEVLRFTYNELRTLARAQMRRERPDHTLDATALVHEACVRLLAGAELPGRTRAEFLRFAARAMRQLLVNHARDRKRLKRGGGARRAALEEQVVAAVDGTFDLVTLDEALERLALVAPRQAQVVELRYFAGLTVDETAEILEISPRAVKRDWEAAGTLLLRELGER